MISNPNAPYGILSYLILGYYPTVEDYFPEYLIKFSHEEKKEILQQLEASALELKHGLNRKDPSRVAHAAKDK
ncbi:MAG: hypothetical protein WBF33_30420, partial [Candidatus Nitrosopolaris sp.]